jgi:hypothetical protein
MTADLATAKLRSARQNASTEHPRQNVWRAKSGPLRQNGPICAAAPESAGIPLQRHPRAAAESMVPGGVLRPTPLAAGGDQRRLNLRISPLCSSVLYRHFGDRARSFGATGARDSSCSRSWRATGRRCSPA